MKGATQNAKDKSTEQALLDPKLAVRDSSQLSGIVMFFVFSFTLLAVESFEDWKEGRKEGKATRLGTRTVLRKMLWRGSDSLPHSVQAIGATGRDGTLVGGSS